MFVKALAGSLVVVFGGFYAFGFFEPESAPNSDQGEQDGAITITEAMLLTEAIRITEFSEKLRVNSSWEPRCIDLRDELMGAQGGSSIGFDPSSSIDSIENIRLAANQLRRVERILRRTERELREAGCDIDQQHGAFTSRQASGNSNRSISGAVNGDVAIDDSEWSGDPNAYNEGGSDDWGQ